MFVNYILLEVECYELLQSDAIRGKFVRLLLLKRNNLLPRLSEMTTFIYTAIQKICEGHLPKLNERQLIQSEKETKRIDQKKPKKGKDGCFL